MSLCIYNTVIIKEKGRVFLKMKRMNKEHQVVKPTFIQITSQLYVQIARSLFIVIIITDFFFNIIMKQGIFIQRNFKLQLTRTLMKRNDLYNFSIKLKLC